MSKNQNISKKKNVPSKKKIVPQNDIKLISLFYVFISF